MPEKCLMTVSVKLEETPQGRKLIADFVRLAHCLMSTTQICRAIEDGSYLKIMEEASEPDQKALP